MSADASAFRLHIGAQVYRLLYFFFITAATTVKFTICAFPAGSFSVAVNTISNTDLLGQTTGIVECPAVTECIPLECQLTKD